MKLKKITTYFVIGAISVATLSACSDNSSNNSSASTEETTTNSSTGLPDVDELELTEQEESSHEHIYQSDYFDENGFFKDVNTSEYISMTNYDNIEIPQEVALVTDEDLQTQLELILASSGIMLNTPEELTDEFMAEITGGQFLTVDSFKETLKEEMIAEQKSIYLAQELMNISTFEEIPETMISYYTAIIEDSIYHEALHYGMTVDAMLIEMGYEGLEDYLDKEMINIENQAKNTLIIQHIAENKEITINDSDIDNFFAGADWSEYKDAWGENYVKSLVLIDLVLNSFSN